ncbi:methylenetetrahydrofolate reductase-like protein [Eremomyces bilateralis CBS 781.70]|uniref:Methylenetetrahydrofolate reductase-like protein n=1 Tax=Eremomyces bilateralis CBS 781.70 TaxID=1392243 RepID=A0A6G1G353_9PEZI|nr:methylenetetrahydrofolate reductase-like protein [Eremomyces bilateralis CBS 781.70]KAF1812346.1 methylenetetrahydrofolate reductase-like protein [Eremomyces bilateralis CBS 781.70]
MEKITNKIQALPENGTYFSLEFFPPKTQIGLDNLVARLERMSGALRPLFVNVTWGAGGSTAGKSLQLAEICQKKLGLTTCLHLTCTNMSRALVDDALEKAKAMGIRNILALRGDPPRSEEYAIVDGENGELDGDSNDEFKWATDLVRYIREQHGDYFCVGVATYPEGHSDQSHPEHQDPLFDLPYLVEKTVAGADFIMSQLFYDVSKFDEHERMLREHPSGAFKDIPIIPGLMPIQSYQILRRVTKLSHASIPPELLERLDQVKTDDEEVKRVGVEILGEVIQHILQKPAVAHKGFHFYTLNLEKVVSQIIEEGGLIPLFSISDDEAVSSAEASPVRNLEKVRSRLSSMNSNPHNRVLVEKAADVHNTDFEVQEGEAGIPSVSSRANTLAISEGEGALGREATWDDYPNGRWGDARSPAFGEIDGYGVSLRVSTTEAVKMWSYPVTAADINEVFRKYINGEIQGIPWSEEGLSAESEPIREQLGKLNAKGWWTIASQPAVNGLRSDDKVFGWGPKAGFVYQKAFVEFFVPSKDWDTLRERLANEDEVTYFAGNFAGSTSASDIESVNPVTWGAFNGKEIITPTIIETVSFHAWREEAFSLWSEWQRIYPPKSATSKLLEGVKKDLWLVNVIHHRFMDKDALWELLLR